MDPVVVNKLDKTLAVQSKSVNAPPWPTVALGWDVNVERWILENFLPGLLVQSQPFIWSDLFYFYFLGGSNFLVLIYLKYIIFKSEKGIIFGVGIT